MVPRHPWITPCVDPIAFPSLSGLEGSPFPGLKLSSDQNQSTFLQKQSTNSTCLSPPTLTPAPSSAQSKPCHHFALLEAANGPCQAGQDGEMKKKRTSVSSGWQMAECWLFLWLGTYVWISSGTLSSSVPWAKPSLAGMSHFPHSSCSANLLLTASPPPSPPPRRSSGLSPTHVLVDWGRGHMGVFSPSVSPAGVVWFPSSELGHAVFVFGISYDVQTPGEVLARLDYTFVP